MTFSRLRQVARAGVDWLDRHLMQITVAALVGAFVFVFLAPHVIVTIPAGHRGVLWRRFGGTVETQTYGEGLHLVLPWNELVAYNVRYQTDTRDYSVVDDQGLQFSIQLSTRFRVNTPTLGELHRVVGPDYLDVVIVPEVSAHVRTLVATMPAQDVYSRLREAIQRHILERIREEIDLERPGDMKHMQYIYIQDILLRAVTLPPQVASAIEEKIRQFHMIQEWQFRRSREEIEAERMRLEGRGIRNFLAESGPITDQYLRLKAIEATLKLAQSPNAKTVIIGSGPQGLPIILGNEPARPGTGVAGPAGPETPGARPSSGPGDGGPRPIEVPLGTSGSDRTSDAGGTAPPTAPTADRGWFNGFVERLTRLIGK